MGAVTWRHLAWRAAGWTTLVLLSVVALAALATAVEQSELGAGMALMVGLGTAPALVLPFTPVCVATGAVLLSARLRATGEAEAFWSLGWSPLRTGRVLVAVGLVVGALQWVASGTLAPATLRWAEGAMGVEQGEWVWVSDTAVRTSDGRAWRVVDGRLEAASIDILSPAEIELAQQLRRPRAATHTALAQAEGAAARVEGHQRRARVLSSALWAWLAWLPLAGLGGGRRVGLTVALALSWAGLDLVLQSLAGQHLLPVLFGAWGGAVLLGLVGLVRAGGSGLRR